VSRNDEPVTVGAIWEAADLIYRQHQPGGTTWAPGTCRQCTPDGCRQLKWAVEVRAAWALAPSR
jgi:hypothetical protein